MLDSTSRTYRHLKYIVDYRKCWLAILITLALLGRWWYFYYSQQTLKTSSFQRSLEKASKINQQVSNPNMVQLMMERDKIFTDRKNLVNKMCKNLTKDNPLYKPRDGTIYFDILWDPHYQVSNKPVHICAVMTEIKYVSGFLRI